MAMKSAKSKHIKRCLSKAEGYMLFLVMFGLFSVNSQEVKYPEIEINNGILKADLYLPDSEDGYYKGTRFDWSGVISNLEFDGHTYFGKWFDDENPPPFATIMGPVEAYAPLNYNDVAVGEGFVKIGVGVLKKTTNENYSDFKNYEIINPGKRTLKTSVNTVEFGHVVNTKMVSYDYTKTIRLVENQSIMQVSHVLRNTGNQQIKTFGFNHNFLVIDNQTIGKDFEMTFPVEVSGEGRGLGDIFDFEGNQILFKRNIIGDESIAIKHLNGLNNNVDNFDVRIHNSKTGVGVKINGNQPLSRFRLWGTSKTICPETYIDIKVAPGETFSWSYFYEFYDSKTERN